MLLVLSNKGKGIQSSSEQPLVGEERYVTTLITTAKETIIILVINKFCYHSYDYRPNWNPLSPITITYFIFFMSSIAFCLFKARL